MPANIPGYYYDEEKKKYFKIQKNHAVPEGSKHTHDSIKRRKFEDQQAREAREMINRQQSRIRKPDSILNHLHGEILLSEMDDRLSVRESVVESLTAGMHKRTVMAWPQDHPQITAFEYDDLGEILFVGYSSAPEVTGNAISLGEVKGVRQKKDTTHNPTFPFHEETVFPISCDLSEVASISLHHEARTLLTTYMGNGEASNRIQLSTLTEYFVNDVRTMYRPGNLLIRGTTAAPPSSKFLFIMASDQGLLSIDARGTRSMKYMNFHDRERPRPVGGHNYTSVEFLNNHPQMICTGKVAGSIDVFDLRKGPGAIETFRHRTAVAKIKSLNEHRILVQGLNQSTCQYDLRFSKEQSSVDGKLTLPFQEYPELDTGPHFNLGFDVDSESGILAAAQADCTVQLFDVASGKRLKYPDMQRKSENRVPVKELKFVQTKESSMKSLWVAWKAGVSSYSLSR